LQRKPARRGRCLQLNDAPPVEVNVNDPRMTAPDDLRTDIRLPLV
jgi:hypothetical protein